ncbi:hypothetical protein ACS0TY_005844 [Phlomoides rotata]
MCNSGCGIVFCDGGQDSTKPQRLSSSSREEPSLSVLASREMQQEPMQIHAQRITASTNRAAIIYTTSS